MTLRQWWCGVRWDHGVLRIENGRYLLVCDSCGWRSHGVTVTLEREPPTYRGAWSANPHIMLLNWFHARK